MTLKLSKSATWGLLILLCLGQAQAQTLPCGQTSYATLNVCSFDSFNLAILGGTANRSFVWTTSSTFVNGQGTDSASFISNTYGGYPGTVFPGEVVACTVTDSILGCSYSFDWEIHISGGQSYVWWQQDNYTGDTSTVHTPIMEIVDEFQAFESNRTYIVDGGTLLRVGNKYNGGWNYSYASDLDTLFIKWNAGVPHEIRIENTVNDYTFLFSNFPAQCYYEETLSSGLGTFISGPDTVLGGSVYNYVATPISGSSYTWLVIGGLIQSGQGTSSISVQWSGTFTGGSVQLSQTLGNLTGQAILPVELNPLAGPFLGNDTTICPGNSFLMNASPSTAHTFLWNTGSTNSQVTGYPGQIYWVDATDTILNVTFRDSISLSLAVVTQANLGPDSTFCSAPGVVLHPGLGFQSFLWSTGSTSPQINSPPNGGLVWVETTDLNNCLSRDSVQLTTLPNPVVNLGPDQSVCQSTNVLLDAGPGFQNYNWFPPASTQMVTVIPPDTVGVTVTDNNSCQGSDTIVIDTFPSLNLNLGPDTTICIDTFLVIDAGSGFFSYAWSNSNTGATDTINTLGMHQVSVSVTGANGCTAADTVIVDLVADCVFPGDHNYDGVANNFDVLAVGVAYGQTGPQRSAASLNWYGQYAPDWSSSLPMGANVKQVDSDGNASINDDDTLAIALNYGFSHNKTGEVNLTGAPLYTFAAFDSVLAGDTAYFDIQLGDSLNLADSVYGLAFTINYDTAIADTHGILNFDFSNCWMGSPGNILTFAYDLYPVPHADVTVVRTNLQDTSGFGNVCRFGIITIDNISGKRTLLAKSLQISLDNIRFINHEMMLLAIQAYGDSTIVFQEETAILQTQSLETLSLSPVPTRDEVYISLNGGLIESLEVFDLNGKNIFNQGEIRMGKIKLNTSLYKTGVYFLKVKSQSGQQYVQKLIIL